MSEKFVLKTIPMRLHLPVLSCKKKKNLLLVFFKKLKLHKSFIFICLAKKYNVL